VQGRYRLLRFVHIADVHLGLQPDRGSSWSEDRGREIWKSLERVIAYIQKEEIELLLIAGDLFHTQPLLRELKELNYLFTTIPNCKIVMIAGNHDYIKRDSNYHTFTFHENVTLLKNREIESVYFPELNTEVYGLSYDRKEIVEPLYQKTEPKYLDRINILLAHGGDAGHIPFTKSEMSENRFHYIALGHIHKPEIIVPDKAAYAGSLEPTDSNDTGRRGFILGELSKGRIRITQVFCNLRTYIPLNVSVSPVVTNLELQEKVRELIAGNGRENIYKIKIQGFKDTEVEFNQEALYLLGNVISVEDESEPDYDFLRLEMSHRSSLIGRYISYFREHEEDLSKEALFYGVQALLESKR
jgi:exonuclease SbcD